MMMSCIGSHTFQYMLVIKGLSTSSQICSKELHKQNDNASLSYSEKWSQILKELFKQRQCINWTPPQDLH